MPPLHLSANFRFESLDRKPAYDYTRSGNPTRTHLTDALSALEGGAGAVATASGMAAVLVALQRVGPGERVVCNHDCYGGTHRLLTALARQCKLSVQFVDLADERSFAAALADRPTLVWVETPSNPLLRLYDLAAVARAAHSVGALCVADNTFLSPALQQPLASGCDVVVHSTTKLINGHSDVVGGALVARDPALVEELAWWANCLGVTQSPFDAYQTLRGLRTLFPRVQVHLENTWTVVELLRDHPRVRRVHYPGLADHPDHALAQRQQRGFGQVVSFELEGGRRAVEPFFRALSLFTVAESLGGVESLACHPASMTHASMDPAARERAGIGEELIRLSVGIECGADLSADLGRALDGVPSANVTATAGACP